MTYLDQNLSLSLEHRSVTVTLDWFAHNNNPLSPPRPAGNFVTPLVCGEEAFAKVYECIEKARHSVDLLSWGFDPSMRLKRDDQKALPLGDLLKHKAEQGVEVRVLIWNNKLAQWAENSVIGEGISGSGGTWLGSGQSEGRPVDTAERERIRRALLSDQTQELQTLDRLEPYDESKRRASRDRLIAIQHKLDALDSGYSKGRDSGGTAHDPDAQIDTRNWFRWVRRGQVRNIEFRTRDFDFLGGLTYHDETGLNIHRGRMMILGRLLRAELLGEISVTGVQMISLSLFPSHHQKMLLTDYQHPELAEGLVMGHNMHRNYWDTTAHLYDDKAANRDIGFGPWQDLSLHVKGPVLFDLNHNFCNAWDSGTSWIRRLFHGSLGSQRRTTTPLSYIRNGGEAAQICRTQPQEGPETTILEIYEKALGNVHQYAYMENQYFRYKPLVERLKETAASRKAAGALHDLYLFVVTNNPESKLFSSSTYETLESLGQSELMPLAHRDHLYDQRQLVYRERELSARPPSPARDRELEQVQQQMQQQNIDKERADELLKLDPNAHYNKATARELEPAMLPPKGMKVIIATLASCDTDSASPAANNQGQRQTEQRIAEALGPEQGTAKYKPIYVHSKLLLVDDLFFTLGSANINARSLLSDSELNIAMPSPKTTRLWRERLWEMHSAMGISTQKKKPIENINADFLAWENIVNDNWKLQKSNLPLKGSLVRFWDLVTPYATALD
ncbi:hypothetical protein NNO07_26635 [Pseudomonas resinovorans]|uniref:PLD phosphodiesterase domain-containing protein n=1 Tax=Metapseudomonas resinovorans TaxID=53412 RepID=A0ABT4YCN8_METRE|nr:phospholipase D-like domain-containing protein [Pseudomonas resinovorans]MDA8486661.1 hypothetical protein [Pseudomonas resinovorans]